MNYKNTKIIFFSIIFLGVFGLAEISLAAPSVTDVSGTVSHGQNITISGTYFGTKSPAAPVWWDDGEHASSIGTVYGAYGYNPNAAPDSTYNMQYHSGAFRNITNPHSHGSRYLAGGHYDGRPSVAYDSAHGNDVAFVLPEAPSNLTHAYLSYYEALDPLYPSDAWAGTAGGRNYSYANHKEINWQRVNCNMPYGGGVGCTASPLAYYAYSLTSTSHKCNPASSYCTYLSLTDNNADSSEQSFCTNTPAYCTLRSEAVGNWTRFEDIEDFTNQVMQIKNLTGSETYADSTIITSNLSDLGTDKRRVMLGGYFCKQTEVFTLGAFSGPDNNGEYYTALASDQLILDKDHSSYLTKGTVGSLTTGQWGYSSGYAYVKDDPSGHAYYAMNTDCRGGEAEHGSMSADAFRYYDDIYFDDTWSHIVLANNSNIDQATIIEPQIPSAWADGSATVKVNLGKLPNTGTAYLFVYDADNNHNATGYSVTLDGTPDITPPASPTGLSVS